MGWSGWGDLWLTQNVFSGLESAIYLLPHTWATRCQQLACVAVIDRREGICMLLIHRARPVLLPWLAVVLSGFKLNFCYATQDPWLQPVDFALLLEEKLFLWISAALSFTSFPSFSNILRGIEPNTWTQYTNDRLKWRNMIRAWMLTWNIIIIISMDCLSIFSWLIDWVESSVRDFPNVVLYAFASHDQSQVL